MTESLLRFVFAAMISAAPAAGVAQTPAESPVAAMVRAWTGSGHADATAEAFAHWNAEGAIPAQCAACHASAGFLDYHGLNGTPAGSVDTPIATGGVVDCDTCHAPGVGAIREITFPSGATLPALNQSAPCMTCHQGRASGPGLARQVEGMAPDAVNPELNFLNPHYLAAAAVNFGAEAQGLFEYPGQSYAGRFVHGDAPEGCVGCHDPHGLEVRASTCVACHKTEELTAIRTTRADTDGDGDVAEGIAAEVATLQRLLAVAIGAYARDVTGAPIAYAAARHPYFFADLNGNGTADPEEAVRDNAYKAWTPRLLAAAYNFQFVAKDPGAYAHNPRYVLQILQDSILDLAAAQGTGQGTGQGAAQGAAVPAFTRP